MSPKEVIFGPSAEKEIKKLQRRDQKTVLRYLDRFSVGDGSVDIEKIKSQPNYYRIKAADFRLVYYPLSSERVVLLVIRNRKDAYKGLNALDRRLETALMQIDMNARMALASSASL